MISASHRPLPDNTQHSQQTDIHAPSRVRTRNVNMHAAAEPRLKPQGYWNPLLFHYWRQIHSYYVNLNLIQSSFTQLTLKDSRFVVFNSPSILLLTQRHVVYKHEMWKPNLHNSISKAVCAWISRSYNSMKTINRKDHIVEMDGKACAPYPHTIKLLKPSGFFTYQEA